MLIPPQVFKTVGCSSNDHARITLQSVLFERDASGKPRAIATNGKRLAVTTWTEDDHQDFPNVGLNLDPKEGFSVVVPDTACKELAKTKPAPCTKPVLNNVALDENTVNGTATFASTDLDITRKTEPRILVDSYPDYAGCLERVRSDATTKCRINPFELLESLKTLIAVTGLKKSDGEFIDVYASTDRPIEFHYLTSGDVESSVYTMPVVNE